MRFPCEPEAHQASPVPHLRRIDETAPIVQCHMVIGEDVAGTELELNGVGGIVQQPVEGVEGCALAIAERPTAAVVAWFDVQAVVADADAVGGVGEDRSNRYRVLARLGLVRAVLRHRLAGVLDQVDAVALPVLRLRPSLFCGCGPPR